MARRSARRHSAHMQAALVPAEDMLRVYLVEDSAPVRERLEAMIDGVAARTVGHARGASEAIRWPAPELGGARMCPHKRDRRQRS